MKSLNHYLIHCDDFIYYSNRFCLSEQLNYCTNVYITRKLLGNNFIFVLLLYLLTYEGYKTLFTIKQFICL
jgi:hypothetical protein